MSPSFETALADLVAVESPSDEPRAVEEALDVLAGTVRAAAGDEATWTSTPDGPPVLAWHRGDPEDPRRVLLLGHADTVWPIGTLAERAFAVDDSGRAYGPGVFDMKAGLVIGVFTLAALDRSWPVSWWSPATRRSARPAAGRPSRSTPAAARRRWCWRAPDRTAR